MSKLIQHAREELQRAGLFDNDCYDGLNRGLILAAH